MNTFHIVIDENMIRNLIQTNIDESMDLLSVKQVLYFIVFGLLPSIYVYKSNIKYRDFKTEIFSKIKVIFISLLIIVASIFLFSKHYTSFAREHKPLRYSVNPTYWIYSIGKYINLTFSNKKNCYKACWRRC